VWGGGFFLSAKAPGALWAGRKREIPGALRAMNTKDTKEARRARRRR
jgi:hypothetical protein